jgi:hypothetical protein
VNYWGVQDGGIKELKDFRLYRQIKKLILGILRREESNLPFV